MTLNLENNFTNPDEAYAAILAAHENLSEADSTMLNAKLILLLANHIGDLDVLSQALIVCGKNKA